MNLLIKINGVAWVHTCKVRLITRSLKSPKDTCAKSLLKEKQNELRMLASIIFLRYEFGRPPEGFVNTGFPLSKRDEISRLL